MQRRKVPIQQRHMIRIYPPFCTPPHSKMPAKPTALVWRVTQRPQISHLHTRSHTIMFALIFSSGLCTSNAPWPRQREHSTRLGFCRADENRTCIVLRRLGVLSPAGVIVIVNFYFGQ
jgi:hypothetical protein